MIKETNILVVGVQICVIDNYQSQLTVAFLFLISILHANLRIPCYNTTESMSIHISSIF